MEHGPVVLLGQGEQYADPDDWRELIRTRRIRRGVELLIRRDGVTTLLRPEEAPELAAVLDAVDPPWPPSQAAPPAAGPPGRPPSPSPPVSSVPLSPRPAAPRGMRPTSPSTPSAASPPPAALPTAAPRRRSFLAVWWWVIAVGVLLFVRLCAPDGFGSPPAFGARADEGADYAPGSDGRGREACTRARGWIARAACRDPGFARLRPSLAQAYTARAARSPAADRAALADEQRRWTAGRGVCRTDAAPGACLARLYRERIAELRTSGAVSNARETQDDAGRSSPGPPPAASARAALAPVTLLERPDWVRRPGPDEFADAYPERAQRLDIDGRALLSCRATASGGLTACDIVSEDPADYGFGGAALRLSRFYQVRPRTADGRPVEGAKVDVPVAFRGG